MDVDRGAGQHPAQVGGPGRGQIEAAEHGQSLRAGLCTFRAHSADSGAGSD